MSRPESASGLKQPILEVRGLQTRFRVRDTTVYAVEGASFALEPGETLGIVGESGSGKSVTALSIMGMIRWPGRIVGGEILFRGENLLAKSEGEMRRLRGRTLAMVPQNPLTSLNPVLTVGDHLRELQRVHLGLGAAEADQRSIKLLQRVGLPDPGRRLREYPHRLSGGQRQRVMIALAMACGPQLLIADEPTTALDVTIQAQILELIDELAQAESLTTILITHNLGIVAGHCDRVVVMYAGHVVESAPVDELFDHPRHPYTLGLLASVPRLTRHRESTFHAIPGMPPIVTEPILGCPFAPRCDRQTSVCWDNPPPLAPMGPEHLAACWHPVETGVSPHPQPPPPRRGEGPMEGDGAGFGDGDGPNPRSPFPRREGGTMAEGSAGFEHGPPQKSPLPLGEGQGEGGAQARAMFDARHLGPPGAIVPSPVATGEGQGEGLSLSHNSRRFAWFADRTSPDTRHPTPDTPGATS